MKTILQSVEHLFRRAGVDEVLPFDRVDEEPCGDEIASEANDTSWMALCTPDIDGSQGRTIVRVLVNLIMVDNSDIVSGAMKLLIRNFSQRSELLRALGQVQLLVSERDVRFPDCPPSSC